MSKVSRQVHQLSFKTATAESRPMRGADKWSRPKAILFMVAFSLAVWIGLFKLFLG